MRASFCLPGSVRALAHLRAADPILGRLIDRVGPCKLKPAARRSPFQALVRAVVYQQLNGAVAGKILSRVLALYPGTAFPSPEQLRDTPEALLQSAGLSRAKAAALKDIAGRTIEGVVPGPRRIREMTDDEIIERLTVIRGVGPWTVHMYLIFTLGRPDVLPATDYGVRQGYALVYGGAELPTPKELLQAGERWRPHRSTAAWYFWRALDTPGPIAGD